MGFEELKKEDDEEEKAGHDIRKDKRKVSRCEGKGKGGGARREYKVPGDTGDGVVAVGQGR